jgi:folate-dependent phosphoribosylglycinamide formyltransferase PurN
MFRKKGGKMKTVNTAIGISGSGTDFRSVAVQFTAGTMSDYIDLKGVISTKENAGGLVIASSLQVPSAVIARKQFKGETGLADFNREVNRQLHDWGVELVILLGCIHKIIPTGAKKYYNIHPADPKKHGGDDLYGLAVHLHVLAKIADLIYRGHGTVHDRYFTYPTVHEVTDSNYDTGKFLLQQAVEIPTEIITDYVEAKKDETLVAERLQQHVLPYEWLMLPDAVKIAAKKILDERRN